MSRTSKIWLIAATFLVLLGIVMFASVMTSCNWDFTKLSTTNYVSNTHQITDGINSISICGDTADIAFVPSANGDCKVDCYEPENIQHCVAVVDNVLIIDTIDQRKWYHHIGIHSREPKITVYIPQGEYGALSIQSDTGDVEIPNAFKFESIDITESTGDVTVYANAEEAFSIKTSTGDIRIENVSADTFDLSVSTGKIIANTISCKGNIKINTSTGDVQITSARCHSLLSSGDTGDISLTDVIAAKQFSIVTSTGDVEFDKCDAGEIYIETDTGDVSGNLLSEKVFITESDTGKINVPKNADGGRCEITTNTGNIRVRLPH